VSIPGFPARSGPPRRRRGARGPAARGQRGQQRRKASSHRTVPEKKDWECVGEEVGEGRWGSGPLLTVFGGATPLTKQVKTAVGPIGRHQAGLLRCVRIVKYTYTNPLSNCMATCGLRGPLSAVLGPCVDSCYCCCIPVWRTCHSRWNARMGPKMGGQLDGPPDSRGGESRPQRTTFGGATPLTKPVKNTLKTAVGTKGSHRADLH
jgi:hypothetical protein